MNTDEHPELRCRCVHRRQYPDDLEFTSRSPDDYYDRARSWTVRSTGARPLTTNHVARLHRQVWARQTKTTRAEWRWLAAEARVPRLDRITVDATPLHRDARSPQDVAAAAPGVKAAIDGLVDARVIPDDNPTHLLAVRFLPPRVCGHDGLELTITEVPA